MQLTHKTGLLKLQTFLWFVLVETAFSRCILPQPVSYPACMVQPYRVEIDEKKKVMASASDAIFARQKSTRLEWFQPATQSNSLTTISNLVRELRSVSVAMVGNLFTPSFGYDFGYVNVSLRKPFYKHGETWKKVTHYGA